MKKYIVSSSKKLLIPNQLTIALTCAFISAISDSLMTPVLPPLVGEFVGPFNAQALWLGTMGTLLGITQLLLGPIFGGLSDHYGRSKIIMLAIVIKCISLLSMSFAPNLFCLLFGHALGGISAGTFAIITAWVADISTSEARAKNYGLLSASYTLGMMTGPLIGGVLANSNLRLPFIIAGILSAVCALHCYLLIREGSMANSQQIHSLRVNFNPLRSIYNILYRSPIRRIVWIYLLVNFANTMAFATWVLYTMFRFDWTSRDNGIALFFFGLIAVVMNVWGFPWIQSRIGEFKLLVFALVSGALTYILYGIATEGWMMYAFTLFNLLGFLAITTLRVVISQMCAKDEQGEVMGTLQSINSLGMIVVPMLGAVLLHQSVLFPTHDWRAGGTFFFCAILQIIGTILALLCINRKSQEDYKSQLNLGVKQSEGVGC